MSSTKRRNRRVKELVEAGRGALASEKAAASMRAELEQANAELRRVTRDLERAQWELEQAGKRADGLTQSQQGAVTALLETRAMVSDRDSQIERLAAELAAAKAELAKVNVEDRDAKKLRRRLAEAKVLLAETQRDNRKLNGNVDYLLLELKRTKDALARLLPAKEEQQPAAEAQ